MKCIHNYDKKDYQQADKKKEIYLTMNAFSKNMTISERHT